MRHFHSFRDSRLTLDPVTINATREVILSAGSIGTPKILQLSGIGNALDLKKLNISVLIDNPSVGSNLFDHTLLPNIFVVKDANANQTFDNLLRDPNQISIQTTDWLTNKTGLFVNNIANNFGFARIALNGSADPAPGPKSPHYEMIFAVRGRANVYTVYVLTSIYIYHRIYFLKNLALQDPQLEVISLSVPC